MTDQTETPKPKCEACGTEPADPQALMPPNRNGHILCEPCFHNDHNAGLDMFSALHGGFM